MSGRHQPLNGADSAEALDPEIRALIVDGRWDLELAALRARLTDAEGESSCCNDSECSCHRLMHELRGEIQDLEGVTA